jgi:hypothetical protein
VNINLRIERLILDSISVASYHRPILKASLETELGRLLAKKGLSSGIQSGGALKTILTDAVDIGETGRPAYLGRRIARAVYGGLK